MLAVSSAKRAFARYKAHKRGQKTFTHYSAKARQDQLLRETEQGRKAREEEPADPRPRRRVTGPDDALMQLAPRLGTPPIVQF